MNVTFANGTNTQQGVVRWVFDNLLHLTLDRFDFDLTVEFVANPEPSIHNEFAFTEVEVGSATMSIRDDFPNFSPTAIYGLVTFAQESIAHELAHALFGQLPSEVQDQVLALFGSTREEWDSEDPEVVPWENRILEGICETFKDAFLRQVDRQFPNRTTRKLPLHKYPAFRDIFRQAMTGGATGGGVEVDYARIKQFVYPQYDTSFPPFTVLAWNTLFSGPSEASGDPYHPYQPDPTQPDFAAYEDSWTNPISDPEGQEDWEVTLPWSDLTSLITIARGYGGTPSYSPGMSFTYYLVTSDDDNVDDIGAFPRAGWVTWWDITVTSYFDYPSDPDVLTGVAMVINGHYAPEGDMLDTWPSTPQFAGYPKVIYTFWEIAPDESYDPSEGESFYDPDDYDISFAENTAWPGVLTIPVKTPPLPAYIGHFLSYDAIDAGILSPYGMIATECDLFKTNGHHPDMFIPPADSITFGGSNGLHRYADDVEPDGFASAVWEDGTYYGVVGRGTNGLSGDSGDDVTIPVTPGQTYSYEFTIPAEWEYTFLHWVFEKRFLGESEEPGLRRYTRFDLTTDSSIDFWSSIAESDNWPDAPDHTNSVVDAVAGTFDPVMEVDRGWGEPESGYFWFFNGSWPMVVREEFVVPEGATEMVVNAQMTITPEDVALTIEEIQAILPEFLICQAGGPDVPAEEPAPPSLIVPGGARGGGNRVERPVVGA